MQKIIFKSIRWLLIAGLVVIAFMWTTDFIATYLFNALNTNPLV